VAKAGSACKWTKKYFWGAVSSRCVKEYGKGWNEIKRKLDTSGKYRAPTHIEFCCPDDTVKAADKPVVKGSLKDGNEDLRQRFLAFKK